MTLISYNNAHAFINLGKERENKMSTNTPAKSEKKNPITAKVVGKSIWYGIIVGIFSGWIKMGWENLFPPRTPHPQRSQPAAAYGSAARHPR